MSYKLSPTEPREFKLPVGVDQNAKSLNDLLPQICLCTERPMTKCIRLVSEASTAVYGSDSCYFYFQARIKSPPIV